MATATPSKFVSKQNGKPAAQAPDLTAMKPDQLFHLLEQGVIDLDALYSHLMHDATRVELSFGQLAKIAELGGPDLADAVMADQAAKRKADAEQASKRAFTMKVTEKGCVQLRGVPGVSVQFGLSLYAAALEFIFAHRAEIEEFIKKNNSKLSRK